MSSTLAMADIFRHVVARFRFSRRWRRQQPRRCRQRSQSARARPHQFWPADNRPRANLCPHRRPPIAEGQIMVSSRLRAIAVSANRARPESDAPVAQRDQVGDCGIGRFSRSKMTAGRLPHLRSKQTTLSIRRDALASIVSCAHVVGIDGKEQPDTSSGWINSLKRIGSVRSSRNCRKRTRIWQRCASA